MNYAILVYLPIAVLQTQADLLLVRVDHGALTDLTAVLTDLEILTALWTQH